MEKLKPNDRATLEGIFSLSQKGVLNTMDNYLRNKYKKVVRTKKYIYAIGNIPVALVAHCDTVFPQPPEDIYYDSEKGVMWSPDGLGADDRAGVWAIIQIIRNGLRPHIILTTDEEKGGVGAETLIKDCPNPIADIKYLIQLDRRGANDCVFYDCANDEFVEYVESFGFVEAYGSFSDISTICPAWKIAGVNLSIGYVDEHSFSETLFVGVMNRTIKLVIRMLKDAKNAKTYEYIESPYAYDWYKNYIQRNAPYMKPNPNANSKCYSCGEPYDDYDLFPIKKADGSTGFVCPTCIAKYSWCERCGEAFETSNTSISDVLCPDCAETLFGKVKVNV